MRFSERRRAFGAVKGNNPGFSAIWQLVTRVAGFSILSAIGLAIDIAIFSLLVHFGLRPGYANLVSAGLAVTFVYFSSAKKVFQYHGRFLLPLFLVYLLYQVAAVLAASFAVDRLAIAGFKPIIAKLLILPVTFTANYISMSFLLRARH
jgi:putative flippase GtrA